MTLKTPMRVAVAAVALLALSACDTIGNPFEVLAAKRPAPDEFQVISRAPLRMPVSATLPEPRLGSASPLDPAPQRQAMAALMGQPVQSISGQQSAGEQALLAAANVSSSDPEIRSSLESDRRDRGESYEAPYFWELFGSKDGIRREDMIDPRIEARRLQSEGVASAPVDPDDRVTETETREEPRSDYPVRNGRKPQNRLPSSQPTPRF